MGLGLLKRGVCVCVWGRPGSSLQCHRNGVHPPALVVQTLAHNSTATLSVIKDYLVSKLQRQSHQIEQDEQRIKKYREETKRIRKEIEELKAR